MSHPAPSSPSVRRRDVLRAGVWAAPVIVLTTSTPARAAVVSEDHTGAVVTIESLVAGSSLDLTGGTQNGPAPASRNPGIGGRFHLEYGPQEWTPPSAAPPAALSATWTVLLTGPTGVQESRSGVVNVVAGDSQPPDIVWFFAESVTGSYAILVTVDVRAAGTHQADSVSATSQATLSEPSDDPDVAPNVAASALSVQAYSISDLDAQGAHRGPLQWNGAQIGYWSSSSPATARFDVDILITGPSETPGGPVKEIVALSGTGVELDTGKALVAGATMFTYDGLTTDNAPGNLPPGTYLATLTVTGTAQSTVSSSASITI